MQPLTLRAFLRQENRIIPIDGYEIISELIISISGKNDYRVLHKPNVLILRNSGLTDKDNQELFEDDLVTIIMPHPAVSFIGRIIFRNGRFIAEGKDYICEDFIPSQIKHIGNFNLNPLVFETTDN